MIKQTQSTLAQPGNLTYRISIHHQDKNILRRLAGKVAELAARPIENEKRNLWYRHNALKPTRPLIFCDPENGWNEIITSDQMECEGELAREWEMTLRKEIFWGESMRDDRVIEPFFNIYYVSTESDWGMHETRIGGQDGGSYIWRAPLKSYADLGKLRFPTLEVDRDATNRLLALAGEVLGDVLTVRLKGSWWWSLGMTWTLVKLRGLEQVMMDMIEYPRELHQAMSFLRDGTLAKLDFLEQNDLLSPNNDGTYVGSGGFGFSDELPQKDFAGKIRTCDLWGFCESQETTSVSPDMFAEFIFSYQLPILERFGLNCYGCCEPLDKRWSVVQRFPRLRRVSVSPWSNLEEMAELLADRYIYSLKPIPTDLAVPALDENRIRTHLRKAMQITKNNRLEVIMKDNHTIGRNPQNVIRWCEIAREEAGKVVSAS